MRAYLIGLAFLALVIPDVASGQAVEVGERVRVRTIDGERFSATLFEVTDTELGLRLSTRDVRVPRDRVQTLERSLGERRRMGRNFLMVTGGGALAVGTLAALADTDRCNDEPLGCLSGGESFVVGFVLGGILSAPIGLLVGLAVHSEAWEPTALGPGPGVSMTLRPLGGGRVAVGASIRLGPKGR